MIKKLFETFRSYLSYRLLSILKKRQLKKADSQDIQIPLELLNDYRSKASIDYFSKVYRNNLESEPTDQFKGVKDEYSEFINSLDEKCQIFENKPYQLGGLDEEVGFLAYCLMSQKKPNVLEIGVANGYSSAILYWTLSKKNYGEITSIDLPKFVTDQRRKHKIRNWAWKYIDNPQKTGTLGDLWPGGKIPDEKYAGWLVPMELRYKVDNVSITGNAFNIVDELDDDYFSFIVFDAMKGYEARKNMFELLLTKLRKNGILCVDGYWVNDAFKDFTKENNLTNWKLGRVGFIKK